LSLLNLFCTLMCCAFLVDAAHAEVIAITDAEIYSMTADQQPLDKGTIVIRDGLIEAIGADAVIPEGARVIDAQDRIVTPGLISAASQLGLIEHSANSQNSDQQVQGTTLGPGFDVQYAVNANSLLIALARADGISRAVTLPGDSGMAPFNGLAALLHLVAGPNILERSRLAVFAHIGGTNSASAGGSRAAQWILLRQALDQAKAWSPPKAGESRALSLADLNTAALKAVVDREIPLLLEVRRESDIRQAIQLRVDFNLKLIILGASEAWRMAESLAAAEIPVILDPAAGMPLTYDELATRADAANILQQAGVLMAFYPSGVLHYSLNAGLGAREVAGLAVANGLPYEAALRALTSNTAEIWDIANGAGSIAAGQRADLVVWDGDPLEPASAPLLLMIDGREVSLETLQTRLRDRYLKPAQTPDGQ
jgi:imidazolonepropionase-like amidohydrolase